MLSVAYAECHMLSVVMLSVVMLSVVAPNPDTNRVQSIFSNILIRFQPKYFKIQIRERAMAYKTNYGRKFGPLLMPEERQNLNISSRKMLFIKVCDEN